MSFKIEDYRVYLKYNEIWNKIKELLGGVKFHSKPIYDDSYIKTKVKTFNDMIKKEQNMHVLHVLVLLLF